MPNLNFLPTGMGRSMLTTHGVIYVYKHSHSFESTQKFLASHSVKMCARQSCQKMMFKVFIASFCLVVMAKSENAFQFRQKRSLTSEKDLTRGKL
jgi:hypothetical protein